MSHLLTEFLIGFFVICTHHPVIAQLLDSLEHFAESNVLWDFVPAKQFFPLCMKIGEEVGKNSADPSVCEGLCERHLGQFKNPKVKQHCKYMAMQMEVATLQETYHGPYGFCKSMLMYQSNHLKIDMLEYVSKSDMVDACAQSIGNALESGGDSDPTEAIMQNLPAGCNKAVGNLYKEHGMPSKSASAACKEFVKKAEIALSAKELSPADQGKQFCDGKSTQAVAFSKSAPSDVPTNFPFIMSNWKPLVTLSGFQKMVQKAFHTPREAFIAYDKNEDGKLGPQEWLRMGRDLGINTMDIHILSGLFDEDKNNKISTYEWQNIMGVTLPELVDLSNLKHQNAENGWKAADKNGDGDVTPKEFNAFCEALAVTEKNAKKLFPQIDKNGDDKISQEEYKNVFGIGIEELKRRMREKHGSPDDSFKAVDVDGGGTIQPQEFKNACKDLNIPKATADTLFREYLDLNRSGDIDPKEWQNVMKMTAEDAQRAIRETFGANPMAMDTNGDGQLSPDEVTAGLEKAGASPEEAAELLKAMDYDGDGILSPTEIHYGIGNPDWDEARGFSEPLDTNSTIRIPEESPVSMKDFIQRVRQAYGTGKEAWDHMAGTGAQSISQEQFKEKVADLGIASGEADKLYKAMDANGDFTVDEAEWLDAIGVSPDEVQDRFLNAFPNPDAALKATDKDGDGQVSQAELEDVMVKKLGLTPEQAKKAAEEMMEELDPSGTGMIPGSEFKAAVEMNAEDVAARIEEKLGSAADAMKQWDKDGDGKLTEAEFEAGAAGLGISPDAAKVIWNAVDKDEDGILSTEDFLRAFGIGPQDVMQRCFQTFGNPSKAFATMDTNMDGLLSPEEWKVGATEMGLQGVDIGRIFKDMDTNEGEATGLYLSKWEFFQYMDYDEPSVMTWGDGYGDIDPVGNAHKQFNELPHTPEAVEASEPGASPHVLVNTTETKASPQVLVNSQKLTPTMSKGKHHKKKTSKTRNLPPMKWQVAKVLEGSNPTDQKVNKLLHDTQVRCDKQSCEHVDEVKSDSGKFLAAKKSKQHHKAAVHRHQQKGNQSTRHQQKGNQSTKKIKGSNHSAKKISKELQKILKDKAHRSK